MRPNVIYAEHPFEWSPIHFWYMGSKEKVYLFSTKYNQEVYKFFQNGKSLAEVKSTHVWNRNVILDRIIESRIPYEMKKRKRGINENGNHSRRTGKNYNRNSGTYKWLMQDKGCSYE